MRNPFGHHHEPEYSPEQIDQAYESKGWGVKLERRIPRPSGGEPLYFQLRLPNGTTFQDIADLAQTGSDEKTTEEAGEGQSLLDTQTEALRALGEAPGVVLVGAVFDQGKAEPLHTLSVLYTPLTSLPETFAFSEPPGWDIISHEQTRLSEHVLRDQMLIARYPERGDDAQVLGSQQYALATELGSLVIMMSRWGAGSGNAKTYRYWDSIANTAYLGEEPAGIVEAIK